VICQVSAVPVRGARIDIPMRGLAAPLCRASKRPCGLPDTCPALQLLVDVYFPDSLCGLRSRINNLPPCVPSLPARSFVGTSGNRLFHQNIWGIRSGSSPLSATGEATQRLADRSKCREMLRRDLHAVSPAEYFGPLQRRSHVKHPVGGTHARKA
jgi:hypothetical protein